MVSVTCMLPSAFTVTSVRNSGVSEESGSKCGETANIAKKTDEIQRLVRDLRMRRNNVVRAGRAARLRAVIMSIVLAV